MNLTTYLIFLIVLVVVTFAIYRYHSLKIKKELEDWKKEELNKIELKYKAEYEEKLRKLKENI